MTENAQPSNDIGWLERSGLPHLLRVLGLAIHPPKLGIALAAIILTFVLGGILDWLWTRNGGVGERAIEQYIAARELDRTYEEPAGDAGIFKVWRTHERDCVLGLLGSSMPGSSLAAGTPVNSYVEAYSGVGPLRNLIGMGYGVWWMFSHHTVYFIIFGVGCLIIWAWGGGAICRIAAVQFARDEKLTFMQAVQHGRRHLFDGFVLAPCIPLAFIVIIMILLAVAGVFLRIPVLGDLVGGITFVLPLIGGIVIALLLVGLAIGGHLFWPAVATEGQDAYDAFSRGLSYAFSRPWKTVLYGVIAVVYAAICWLVVQLFTLLSLTVARGVMAWGTSPFGWWARGSEDAPTSKLEMLWPLSGPNELFAWPNSSAITWNEYIATFFIAVYVLLVAGLMWAFLTSFYFSGATVIYFLLRRDVDKTDLEDVYLEDDYDMDAGDSGAADTASGQTGDTALPVVNEVASPPSAEPPIPLEPDTPAPSAPEPGTASESDTPPETDATTDRDGPPDSEPPVRES